MAIVKQHVAVLDGTVSVFSDRVSVGQLLGVANAVGSGAGTTVSTVVTFAEPLPPSYSVHVGVSQAALAWVTARTTFGFTVNLAPLLAATTLPAGTFDVLVASA